MRTRVLTRQSRPPIDAITARPQTAMAIAEHARATVRERTGTGRF
jgi:hypothetical protein